MNFNLTLLIILCFFALSCGLKNKPKAPSGTNLPSLIDQHSYKVQVQKKSKTKKKK